jgi:hypothetical protein
MSDARRDALVEAGREAMGDYLDAFERRPRDVLADPTAPHTVDVEGYADEMAAKILGP